MSDRPVVVGVHRPASCYSLNMSGGTLDGLPTTCSFPRLALSKDACGLASSLLCRPAMQSAFRLPPRAVGQNLQHQRLVAHWFHGTCKGQEVCPALALAFCAYKVLPRLHSDARLRCCHHTLLAVVYTPKTVKFSEVHIGLNTAILTGWK